ncbi:MAG: phosphatidate cytidylyltransferase [Treponema sp.]|nr:phosphatidate cytidylyltransferase [Treponema sp.]
MKKIIERLLIFFIGIPAIIALVLFLPWFNNLALNITAIFFSAMGAVELSAMLEKKQIRVSKIESFILGALAPLAITLHVSFDLPQWIVPVLIMSGAGLALLSGIFSRLSEIENGLNKIIGCFSLLIYPGFFMYWVIKMNSWENAYSSYAILLFLLITVASDSIAWLFGTILGANNRGLIAVSPNKSIAGFIGGITGAILVAIAAVFIAFQKIPVFPMYAFYDMPVSAMLLIALIIGFCTGIAAMAGDLAESAIKRSCDLKDSGNFMLGRGGVLDSIDSIVVAAPVFYLLYNYLFIH